MLSSLRRILPVAVLAAVAASAFTLIDGGGADAAGGTTELGGAAGQSAYFFFDAQDTAGAAINPEDSNADARAYNASSVCDNNPALEAAMAAGGSDAALWYCVDLVTACTSPQAGRLLGITVAPGKDPEEVLAASTCWNYSAGESIERTAPVVYLPTVTAQDPVFQVTTGSVTAEPSWTLGITVPGGLKTGTEVRASEATVDGSIALHSLGITSGAGEAKAYDFKYLGWDGEPHWAMVGANDEWITTSLADGVTMDPQACLDSGICHESRTLQYVDGGGHPDSAVILPHM